MPPHAEPSRRIVLKLRLAGLSLRQIAAELKINIKTAHSDVVALRGQGSLKERGVSILPCRRRLTMTLAPATMLA
jgi:hypothetical protein